MFDERENVEIKEIMKNHLEEDIGRGRTYFFELFPEVPQQQVRRLLSEAKDEMLGDYVSAEEYEELLEHSEKRDRALQKTRDNQRITNKYRRAEHRNVNAAIEYATELIEAIKERHEPKELPPIININEERTGVVLIGDCHFNELVDMAHNKYDFKVASRRLKKYTNEIKKHFKNEGINRIHIAQLGDLINSDRRLDEKLNMATNRAKASYISAQLLEMWILDLREDFDISISMVSGNESRIDQEYGMSDMLLSNNYDWNINEILKIMFRGTDVKFLDGPVSELVVSIQGKNFLFLHGNQVKRDVEKSVVEIMGKYSKRGITIDHTCFGHIHSSCIADFFVRNSSLVGDNEYSNSLHCVGGASQTILTVGEDGINAMKIDLQQADHVEGYPIDEQLEAYNAKSLDKAREGDTKYYVVGVV